MSLLHNSGIFDDIYKKRKWYIGSGTGSIAIFNQPYLRFINHFLQKHPDIRTVVDIGCGDWQIGRHLALGERMYIGCDVSPRILASTKKKFSAPLRRFVLLDAVHEELPDGDLAIVRDVLQHLSNKDVAIILEKLEKYKYVVLQNDIFMNATANTDIENGDHRVLNVTVPPFNASRYRLKKTYTEVLLHPLNTLRILCFYPPFKKGIFVNQT